MLYVRSRGRGHRVLASRSHLPPTKSPPRPQPPALENARPESETSVAIARAARDQAPISEAAALSMLPQLQRLAGNAAAGRLVGVAGGRLQRAPLTAVEKEANLASPRYAGDPDLEAAYDNSPALRNGRKGDGVAKMQGGLVDDGFPMPISMKSGAPDGIFGKETHATVKAFQGKHGLKVDGEVGRQTMGRLDELAGGAGPKPKPPEPKPEIAATEEEMGKHVAQGMEQANVGASATSGVWYDYNYFAEHKKDPATFPWDDEWRNGLASPEYFDRTAPLDWRLKPGKSASEGIKAWLKGLTIAECLTCIVAIEIDTLRAAIGDAAFDAQFGSTDTPVPENKRLRIRQDTAGTPVEGKFKATEAVADPGTLGHRNVKVGDWVYFYNHPRYLLKHPGGAWQGENAVYVGDNAAGQQLFSGLGASDKTEAAMIDEDMVDDYNRARNGDDYVSLLDTYAGDTPEVSSKSRTYLDHDTAYTKSLYEKYKSRIPAKYREDSGEFDDTTSREKILDDPPYELDGTVRKGGFYAAAAARLDPAKVAPPPTPPL
jgi:Putative peptidoglycan binding domain/Protein-glutamine gamma-glutamyltransferase